MKMSTATTLIGRIRADRDVARKGGDSVRAKLLTTLFAEAAMVGKNAGNRESTDDEVVSMVKKFVANIDETRKLIAASSRPDDAALARLAAEREVVSAYLPAMADADELRAFIGEQVGAGANAIGPIMGAVKKQFGAAADMKLANAIARELLG